MAICIMGRELTLNLPISPMATRSENPEIYPPGNETGQSRIGGARQQKNMPPVNARIPMAIHTPNNPRRR